MIDKRCILCQKQMTLVITSLLKQDANCLYGLNLLNVIVHISQGANDTPALKLAPASNTAIQL